MKPVLKVQRHCHLILPPPLAQAVDEWRLKNQRLGTRPEAIREILERALGTTTKAKTAAASAAA